MISGHLDSSDIDDHPINFEKLERNYIHSMTLRNIMVAKLLGTQSPDSISLELNNEVHITEDSPK